MNEKLIKIRVIYIPFLLIGILFITLYTFFNWLTFIKLELFSIKEAIIDMVIPAILIWVPLLYWLKEKLQILNLKKKNGDSFIGLYLGIAWLIILASTIISQEYMRTATGKLTEVDTVNEIVKKDKSKYYKITNYHIDKKNSGVATTFDVSGKNSDRFNMHIYIALPIITSINDTISPTCLVWYGKEYHEQISNRLAKDEKEAKYQLFAQESQDDFDTNDLSKFIYLDRIPYSDDKEGFLTACKKSSKFSNEQQIILVPINEAFQNRNGNKLAWLSGIFTVGAIIWLVMILIPKIDQEKYKGLENGKLEADHELKEFIDFFKPQKDFYITPILIVINLVVYLIMFFKGLGFVSFKGTDLLTWGANYRPLVITGEWWRLSTSTFLHGGLMHVLVNMQALLFIGIFLEPILGKSKFLISYIISGLIASLASIWWHDATISVGASGAIFGMYGISLTFMLTKIHQSSFNKAFLSSIVLFVILNLIMGLMGNIDNAAHIGGLASGFLLGLILSLMLKKEIIKNKHNIK